MSLTSLLKRVLVGVLFIVGVVYVAVITILVATQRRIVWKRPKEIVTPRSGSVQVLPAVADRPLYGAVATLYFAPRYDDAAVLVFFHGNADQLGWGAEWLGQRLNKEHGLGFLAVEYPSYGLSVPGFITEATAYEAAERALKFATLQSGLKLRPERIVLFGESIGCCVALEMASRGWGRRVVLVAAFLSLPEMIRALIPRIFSIVIDIFPFLVRDKFDNTSKKVNVPLCLIHGDCDEIVPFEHGRQLGTLCGATEFHAIANAGHNDVFNNTTDDALSIVAQFASAGRAQNAQQ